MFKFSSVGIPVGETVYFKGNPSVSAVVVDDSKILMNGALYSLSGATLRLLNSGNKPRRSIQGTKYWLYNGVALSEFPKVQ